ncbi:hypothetical protein ANANG_G00280200 [Anguilla anguilla]|uniref:Uncharacterized protein n=1 Tax=Anguilla anguilla TaxID=7936 RepID=A0A9D3LWB9_ANGAN|nr:hypothetical protein ANANG_G00280200 [Anguilla anguilla]
MEAGGESRSYCGNICLRPHDTPQKIKLKDLITPPLHLRAHPVKCARFFFLPMTLDSSVKNKRKGKMKYKLEKRGNRTLDKKECRICFSSWRVRSHTFLLEGISACFRAVFITYTLITVRYHTHLIAQCAPPAPGWGFFIIAFDRLWKDDLPQSPFM